MAYQPLSAVLGTTAAIVPQGLLCWTNTTEEVTTIALVPRTSYLCRARTMFSAARHGQNYFCKGGLDILSYTLQRTQLLQQKPSVRHAHKNAKSAAEFYHTDLKKMTIYSKSLSQALLRFTLSMFLNITQCTYELGNTLKHISAKYIGLSLEMYPYSTMTEVYPPTS